MSARHSDHTAPERLRDDIAEAAARTLRAHPTVRAAVLFESRARGDHRPDSDWDIALIVGETATAYNEIEAALSALPGVSPVCVREAAMRICAHRTDSVHAAIATEGIVIAGIAPELGPAPRRTTVAWSAVNTELAEARRTLCVLALKLVPKGRKDAGRCSGSCAATGRPLTRGDAPRCTPSSRRPKPHCAHSGELATMRRARSLRCTPHGATRSRWARPAHGTASPGTATPHASSSPAPPAIEGTPWRRRFARARARTSSASTPSPARRCHRSPGERPAGSGRSASPAWSKMPAASCARRSTCTGRRCAARLYERASTDVDAGESTHAACKRAIEACENDEPWSIDDRDGTVFVESIERIGEADEARGTVEVPGEFRETPRVHPRQAPHTAVAFKIVDRRLGALWPGPGDETEGAGALDVRACIDKEVTLAPGESAVVSAGFTIDASVDEHEVVLAPHPARTVEENLGLARVIGGVGSDEVMHIAAWNHSAHEITIEPGAPIARLAWATNA